MDISICANTNVGISMQAHNQEMMEIRGNWKGRLDKQRIWNK